MNTEEIVDFETLEANIQSLIQKSAEAREFSYSPYSKFKVGAAILCKDGTTFNGCNIENASYPVGICAERTAIAKALSEGKRKFQALAVVADKGSGNFITPCGICRQFVAEFDDITIYLSGTDMKSVLRTTASCLLPRAFTF